MVGSPERNRNAENHAELLAGVANKAAAAVEPILESVEDAAKRLGVGRSTVYQLLGTGDLEAVKIGRARRVVIASEHRFVERLRSGAAA